ncbi:MAG: gephyrin-like molybdotransferase Glp [Alphaproteobacteria bacterium]
MLSFEDALEKVLANFQPMKAVETNLNECLGAVLAEDTPALLNQPPHAVSAMDGYAVKAADTNNLSPLKLIGASSAGHPFAGKMQSGECVRIFTGAYLPNGADAVLIQEDTRVDSGNIQPTECVGAGKFVRPKGLDFTKGDVLEKGTVLTSRALSLAASYNHNAVKIHTRPRIAILSSGDEIKLPGSQLIKGQIVSSNHIALSALVKLAGGEPTFLGIAPDELKATENLIDKARGYDLLLTTGGASVGDHDLMKQAFINQGAQLDFWKIAMKPGKPMIFGALGDTPVLGLPGNPVSSYITALLFAFPAIRRMFGHADLKLPTCKAVLKEDLRANRDRREFRRIRLEPHPDGTLQCSAYGNQDSSMLSRLSEADGLINVAPFAELVEAGTEVKVLRFPD